MKAILQPQFLILAAAALSFQVSTLNPQPAFAQSALPDSFNPGAGGDGVCSLAVQADKEILVGGAFTTLGAQTRNYIGRLNPDGTLDNGFSPGAGYLA